MRTIGLGKSDRQSLRWEVGGTAGIRNSRSGTGRWVGRGGVGGTHGEVTLGPCDLSCPPPGEACKHRSQTMRPLPWAAFGGRGEGSEGCPSDPQSLEAQMPSGPPAKTISTKSCPVRAELSSLTSGRLHIHEHMSAIKRKWWSFDSHMFPFKTTD